MSCHIHYAHKDFSHNSKLNIPRVRTSALPLFQVTVTSTLPTKTLRQPAAIRDILHSTDNLLCTLYYHSISIPSADKGVRKTQPCGKGARSGWSQGRKRKEKKTKSRLNEARGVWCIRKSKIGSPLNNQILANYPKIWNGCSNAPGHKYAQTH